jgi:ACT domain-containing protein
MSDGERSTPDDEARPDGGQLTRTHTIRLELPDEPGQLLAALSPIAEHGGNLLSVHHERGDRTPRGRIPVEIALECPPERFEDVLAALRAADVDVFGVDAERYRDALTVLLVGHAVDTGLSDTLARIEDCGAASVSDVALDAPEGTDRPSSVRLRLAVEADGAARALETVRTVADDKGLRVVEPLAGDGR